MGKELSDLFGREETKTAEKLITALADDAAKIVQGAIVTHEKAWTAKKEQERKKLVAQASLWARRQSGHRINCPACKSDALVHGEPISVPRKSIKGDLITEKKEFLPSKFECVACSLKIAGLSQLSASGLGDVYAQTRVYDANEYYAPADE